MKPLGKFHELTAAGFIVNDCRPLSPSEWDEPISLVMEKAQLRLGQAMHSAYLRGSLARGTWVNGVSDLDMLVIYEDAGAAQFDWRWTIELSRELMGRFPFCAGLDANFLNKKILEESPKGASYRFMLKTQSLCIYGDDIIGRLPPCRPDTSAMFSFRGLAGDIDCAAEDLDSSGDATGICRWLMRRIVRAAGEIAMLQDGRFTRDLCSCTETYLSHFGFRITDSLIPTALKLAITPESDRTLVLEVGRSAYLELQEVFEISKPSQNSEL